MFTFIVLMPQFRQLQAIMKQSNGYQKKPPGDRDGSGISALQKMLN